MRTIQPTQLANNFHAVDVTVRHILPEPLLSLLHLLMQRKRCGEGEIDQRHGGEIANQLVDLRVKLATIAKGQVKRERLAVAPAL